MENRMALNSSRRTCVRVAKALLLSGAIALSAQGTPAAATTTYVPAGADLQAVLNAAQPGDVIVLQAGARFVGTFRLPPKPAGPVITIRSSATLPERRLAPTDAGLLPTLATGVVSAVLDGSGSANWRLDGIQFESVPNGEGEVIVLQNSTNIYLDRLVILAGPNGQKRGIRGNGRQITLTRSYIGNIWRSGQDSQAFCAWDGAGPYTITNNYLEAASENVMFGGADSPSPDRVPADILVEGNYFNKRPDWQGQPLAVKNLFELKSAKRITIRGNLFERNWTDGQTGFGIVLKVANQQGTAPWSVLEDVLFENNVVRNTENGFNILGNDDAQPSGRATRITIRNNLLVTPGIAFQLGGEIGTLTIDHNTVDQGYTLMALYTGTVWNAGAPYPRSGTFAVEQLTFANNLAWHHQYGVKGDGTATGSPSLFAYTRTLNWTNNVLAGAVGWTYPSVTWMPTVAEYRAQFDQDYRLTSSSVYHRIGSDGRDLGVDWTAALPLVPSPRNLRIAGGS
jgi:hypothetical protein